MHAQVIVSLRIKIQIKSQHFRSQEFLGTIYIQ